MKRTITVLAGTGAVLLALASAGLAAPNQPGQGESSTGRNDAGFGGGPHCHVLVVDSAQTEFDLIRVYPSHTAHVHTGLPTRIFAADADCDGQPG